MLFAAVDTNAVIARIWQTINANQDLIARKGVEYAPKVATAVVILVIGVVIARWIGRGMMRQLPKILFARDVISGQAI